ncbi:hypothetical protein [Roseibium sp. RKSG952]|uniref:hypothetical protein n=1 Tax=Roseibium sp. RKSG952 TaxID=2529384 RepID=UPI0012BD7590|nr:hypothetical protein [Roseibium sp. RKSG952]MTH96701.1 hypothetical protein [Roseibium sp. RKSG952]
MKKFKNTIRAAFVGGLCVLYPIGAMATDACDPQVEQILNQQREAYINGMSDLADQNFSRRSGSFASTTCLDTLMTTGGLDIFFKPPSLSGILDMVKNLACDQASQIFDQVLGGVGGGAVGQLPSGIIGGADLTSALGGTARGFIDNATSTVGPGSGSGVNIDNTTSTLEDLFK